MKNLLILLSLLISFTALAQEKKVLDHSAYDIWRKIEAESISPEGRYIQYTLASEGYADPIIVAKTVVGTSLLRYERGHNGSFSSDGKFLTFTIDPGDKTLRELKRIKTDEDELPNDTLAIYSLDDKTLRKVPNLQSYKLPEKWGGWLAYQLQNYADTSIKVDKKLDKDNGFPLVLENLVTRETWEFPYVQEYGFSEKGSLFGFISSGNDSTFKQGVYTVNTQDPGLISILETDGKLSNLAMDEMGTQVSFIADPDTTKALVRNPEIYYWESKDNQAKKLADRDATFLPQGWLINAHQKPIFSQDGSKLFFGTNPIPITEDTTLLEDEIVNVEVWAYTDPRLHTQQKIDKKDDAKKGYHAVYDIASESFVQLGNTNLPEVMPGDEGNADVYLAANNQPYLQSRSWEGFPDYNDLYMINASGEAQKIATKVRGEANLSPAAKYAYWYDYVDSAWFSYEVSTAKTYKVTSEQIGIFYDEENDSPDYPSPYGMMSWTEDDQKMLIYDRFDIWEVDPRNAEAPQKLTNGRARQVQHRYVKLDPEERFVGKNQTLLLTAFHESDKSEVLYAMNYGRSGRLSELTRGDVHYGGFQKARDADQLIYNFQNFETFPDIHTADLGFKGVLKISNANPQQSEYRWGTAELYRFTSLDGVPLEGLLIKPEGFDPDKQYPMIVNYYETSSDGLHRYREPSPGRSTMSYSFYASRGYVIFNPDVRYKIGYPGESAYNCVMPGVTALIQEGFVDKDRVGLQGHSWGGYQNAYLATRTNLFRAIEAGAPVPNMVSAYGGIRWWTGLSRMFQYEHTQSRIGGSLWEEPLRYIENSPIFFLDKVQTPILIMHNDADGHVPWYQGIELFVALRRLGKPSWMLNYQGEPHWPLKLQNKIDFNIRLQQFFDYYLQDAPMPEWMREGVPALQMGIDQNLELIDKN